jgi:hypothetical protein
MRFEPKFSQIINYYKVKKCKRFSKHKKSLRKDSQAFFFCSDRGATEF